MLLCCSCWPFFRVGIILGLQMVEPNTMRPNNEERAMQNRLNTDGPMDTEQKWSRRACSRFLKQADALLRLGKKHQALQAVEAAKKSDPSNPYCSAYLERIRLSLLADEKRDEIEGSLGAIRQFLSIGLVDLALQRVIELLSAFPACTEARALRSEIIHALIQEHMYGHAQHAA
jgi:hypothetical protein